MAASFPEIVDAFRALSFDAVLDGELVVCDEMGRPVFERLKARAAKRKAENIRRGATEDPAAIFAFDLLSLNGDDYRQYPLTVRKVQLAHILKGSRCIKYADHFETSPAGLWEAAKHWGLEGIVAKKASSMYTAGRSDCWLKIKTQVGVARERERRPR